MQVIVCPHCKKEIKETEIAQALHDEVVQQVTKDQQQRFKEELEKIRLEEKEKTAKKIKEDFELQMKLAKEEAEEEKEKNKKLHDQILELTKLFKEQKEKNDLIELENLKKLQEEREKIKEEIAKNESEKSSLKLAELQKQLDDTKKALDDAQRKSSQVSQQLQGETFELAFEKLLTQKYINDKISPVGKGIKGGDVIQEVWDAKGNYVGKILWELKNTKLWSEGWIEKLKADKRAINADEAILISEVLPSEIKIAGFKNGVWVTKQSFAIPLADTMRAKLIQLFYAKKAAEGKGTKMEILYDYLSGSEFRNRVEAIIEAFSNMQQEIEKEKRYFSNKWARDEKNIRQVIDSTYGMHGDLKGIIGSSLPQISGIDAEVIEIIATEEQKLL